MSNLKKHANVSIFIPHNGCPHQCSFCNQKTITGQAGQPSPDDVKLILSKAGNELKKRKSDSQIAFFGGSFTAIDRVYMTQLLDVAYEFVKNSTFDSIRLSTRPDAIDYDILKLLKNRGVKDIELGCQSMDDEVLHANERGHSERDIVIASKLIQDFGFNLGLQMMTGLYKSTIEKDRETAKKIADLKPSSVRIYPTVIMRGTKLADLYNNGTYIPYSMDTTVELCAELLEMFEHENIPVIRLGLHDSKDLKNNMLAGAYHPALRELCESKRFLNKVLNYIESQQLADCAIEILVHKNSTSKMIGQKKSNIQYLRSIGIYADVKEDNNLSQNDILIMLKE